MEDLLSIKPLCESDIDFVTEISRKEGFAPGVGDLGIYQNTDKQGLWVGWLNDIPIGCIAGVRYNQDYGFLGLFLVIEKYNLWMSFYLLNLYVITISTLLLKYQEKKVLLQELEI